MNKAGKIAIGCLLAPVGLFAIAVFLFAAVRMAGVPEPEHKQTSLEQVVAAPRPELDRQPLAAGEIADAIAVDIELEEGMFEIVPGPAADGIRVDADYDEASYVLEQNYGMDSDVPSYTLRFKSKISLLRRIAADGSFSDEDMEENHITVQLPIDTPMILKLKISKSEAEIDLTGLALYDLDSHFNMGDFALETAEDNSVEMERFRVKTSMGEFQLQGISHFRAATVQVTAGMGESRVDFGGPLLRDTELLTKMRLGEMRLRLPENAQWNADNRFKASMGEVNGDLVNPGTPERNAPLLTVSASVFMGELGVQSYRIRRRDLPQTLDRDDEE